MLHTLHGKFHEINTCGCSTQTKCSEAVYSSVVELSRVRAELPWGVRPRRCLPHADRGECAWRHLVACESEPSLTVTGVDSSHTLWWPRGPSISTGQGSHHHDNLSYIITYKEYHHQSTHHFSLSTQGMDSYTSTRITHTRTTDTR